MGGPERGHGVEGEGLLAGMGGGGWPLVGRRCGGAVGALGWKVGAVGRVVGATVVTRCDSSRRAEWSARMSSLVGTSLATTEDSSWILVQGY